MMYIHEIHRQTQKGMKITKQVKCSNRHQYYNDEDYDCYRPEHHDYAQLDIC